MSNNFAIICTKGNGLFLSYIDSFTSMLNAKDELLNIYEEYTMLGYKRKNTKNELELILCKTKQNFIFINTFTVIFKIVTKKNIFKDFPINSLTKTTNRTAVVPINEHKSVNLCSI